MTDHAQPSSSEPHAAVVLLLQLGLESKSEWRPEELAAALDYHLHAPLDVGLTASPADRVGRSTGGAETDPPRLKNLGDLFRLQRPPIHLLQAAKDFAKSCMTAAESPLPKQVAAVLYYLSIAVAMARLDHRISDLADSELRKGLDWALSLSWVDASTKALLSEARVPLVKQDGGAGS